MLEIKTFSPKSHKIKCLIYGASGTGKTTFGGSAEDVIFASVEDGLLSIADKKVAFAEIKTIENFIELKDFLKNENHHFKTLVIDSITEINNKIKESIEKKTGRQMQIKEWGELAGHIKKILSEIKDIDMNVIIIAQEQLEKDEEKIQKIIPSLNGKLATEICYFMDIVGYIFIDNKGKRKLITAPSEKLLTKDRTKKIGNDEELNFEKWIELVNTITDDEEELLYTIMTSSEKKVVEMLAIFENHKKDLESSKTLEELKTNFMKIKLKGDKLKELIEIKDKQKYIIENNNKIKTINNITKES